MPGYDPGETIVAPATAPSAGAIGIVRLSGNRAWEIVQGIAHGLPASVEPRRAYVCSVSLPGRTRSAVEVRDRCVALLWRGPRSYTGEDMAELMLHGSPLLMAHVVEMCVQSGARHAQPGEFTYRACLNGKLDLAQAEAVSVLIGAGSARGLELAAAQLAGLPGRRIRGWIAELQALLAGIEVIHDYAADDLDASLDQAVLLDAGKLQAALDDLLAQMDAALEDSRRSAPLREGVTVAICGPPNVGKSTLFNALVGHERALTAPEPGTTRDYLTASLDGAGLRLTLVDTAGYRDAADAVEAAGVQRAGEWARAADRVLWVSAADDPDGELPAELAELDPLRVVTRCDLLPEWPTPAGTGLALSAHFVSGLTGRGIPELRDQLAALPDGLGEPALDSFGRRQAHAVGQARASLVQAREALATGMPMDAAALDIYAALEHLHGVFEQADRNAVIAQVFSGFCVGK